MAVADSFEQDLRAALRPRRPTGDGFAAGVRARIEATRAEGTRAEGTGTEGVGKEGTIEGDPGRSARLRTAASFLPIPLLVGGKLVAAGAKSGAASTGAKVLGYAALPAISLFLVLGAGLTSVLRIRRLPGGRVGSDGDALQAAFRAWWRRYWLFGLLCYGAAFASVGLGLGWVFFLLMIVSLIALGYMLRAFTAAGIASRQVVGTGCATGLFVLACAWGIAGPLGAPSTVFDPMWGQALLFLTLAALAAIPHSRFHSERGPPRWLAACGWIVLTIAYVFLLDSPRTVSGCLSYVAEMNEAGERHRTWRQWEPAATWVRRTDGDANWQAVGTRLRSDIEQERDATALSVAARVGLLEPGVRVPDHARELARLLDPARRDDALPDVEGADGHIRLAVLQGALEDEDKELLVSRLHARWVKWKAQERRAPEEGYVLLRLLEDLGQPLALSGERAFLQAWLVALQVREDDGRGRGRGFAWRVPVDGLQGYPDARATWFAMQLIERVGVPAGLDGEGLRRYLQKRSRHATGDDWARFVSLRQLDEIQGRPAPGFWAHVDSEKSLIALLLLCVLCVVATWRAPVGPEPDPDADPPAFEFVYEA